MLLSLIALPFIGSIVIMSVRTEALMRVLGTLTSLLTFLFSLGLWVFFDNLDTKYQFTEVLPWFGSMNIPLYLGIDGISLFMILLTTFLTPICIVFSFQFIKKQLKLFIMLFLIMESLLIFTFSVLDLIIFSVVLEKLLIMIFLSMVLEGGMLTKKQGSLFNKMCYLRYCLHDQHNLLQAKYKSGNYIVTLFLIPNFSLICWTIFYSDINFSSLF